MRWSWVNFQCRGVLLIWIRVGQGPTALAVDALVRVVVVVVLLFYVHGKHLRSYRDGQLT